MRLYTCCPHQGCTAYRDAMSFLEGWGIEPEIGQDDEGHFFEFCVPEYWSKGRKRSFAKAISGRVVAVPTENAR